VKWTVGYFVRRVASRRIVHHEIEELDAPAAQRAQHEKERVRALVQKYPRADYDVIDQEFSSLDALYHAWPELKLVIRVTGTSTPALAALAQQLIAGGASVGETPDAVIVGVSDLADAAKQAERLAPQERRRAVFVGIDDTLDLAGFLEANRPLAVMSNAIVDWRPESAGFIGRKELAVRVESPISELATSPHYGAYTSCQGANAGQFLARYLRAATEVAS